MLGMAGSLSFRKGMILWGKETLALKEASSESNLELRESSLRNPINPAENTDIEARKNSPARPKLHESDIPPAPFPARTIYSTLSIWFVYLALKIGVVEIGSKCSSGAYALLACIYPPLIFTSVYGVYCAAKKQEQFPAEVLDGDIEFAPQLFTISNFYPSVGVLTVGVLTSLLGIGGGEIIGPLLLSLHVLPQVTSATIAMMSGLSTFALVISDSLEGEVNYNFFGVLFAIGLVGGTLGRYGAVWFSDRYKRPSLLVFSLVAVVFISIFYYLIRLTEGGYKFSISSYCLS